MADAVYRTKRPCRWPTCGELIKPGTKYCSVHAGRANEFSTEIKGTMTERGYGHQWRKVRMMVLRRNPMCQWPECDQAASEVDHIVPKSQGGAPWDMDNLQSLCRHHHSAKTVKVDGGFGRERK